MEIEFNNKYTTQPLDKFPIDAFALINFAILWTNLLDKLWMEKSFLKTETVPNSMDGLIATNTLILWKLWKNTFSSLKL
jgi:hypothetical protein